MLPCRQSPVVMDRMAVSHVDLGSMLRSVSICLNASRASSFVAYLTTAASSLGGSAAGMAGGMPMGGIMGAMP